MNDKVKTPIVDKNGKATHVHKKIEENATSKRKVPNVSRDNRINPVTGFTAEQYVKLKEILRTHLDRDNQLILSDSEFVERFVNNTNGGELWMSNRVNEFKLLGNGTMNDNFHITTRSASRGILEAVDKANFEIAEVFGHKIPDKVSNTKLDVSVSGNTITFTTPSGVEVKYDAYPTPSEYVTPLFETTPGGDIIGRWASDDNEPTEYEWMEGDSFETFRSEDARNEYIESKVKDGVPREHIFIVDKYDHSAIHYSVSDTKSYADRQWDVAPSGVFIMDADEANAALGAVIDNEIANIVLNEYSEYCNGEVYGLSATVFDKNGEEKEIVETVWGWIGQSSAEEAISEGY